MNISKVLKESFFAGIIIYVVNAFSRAYDNSVLKKAVSAVSVCFLSSRFFSLLSRYANKKAFYRYSLIYRLIMAIAGLFDRLFGFIHRLAASWLAGSAGAANIREGLNSSLREKLFGFGVLFMSIPVGSMTAILLLGGISKSIIAASWCSFAIGLVLTLCGAFEEALKRCFLVRGIKAFLDIL